MSAQRLSFLIASIPVGVVSTLLVACNIDVPVPLTDVHVQIDQDGSCFIAHAPVACAGLGDRLSKEFPNQDCHIIVEADHRAAFESVGQALQSIQRRGFVKIEFGNPTRTGSP